MSETLKSIVGGATRKSQIFSSSGTWVQPNSNVTNIEYLVLAAGSGGENKTGVASAAGGTGGEYIIGQAAVSGDVTVTVGAGGLGGLTGGDNIGTSGGHSELTGNIDFDILAIGGNGGASGSNGGSKGLNPNGVTSGYSTGGSNTNIPSGFAYQGNNSASGLGLGGAAGIEKGGNGGDAGSSPTSPTAGGIGAGGGGQARDGGAGAGGDGVVIIYWWE